MRRSIIDYPAQKGALPSSILSAFILVVCLLTAAISADGSWTGWAEALVIRAPSCTNDGAGSVVCAVKGTDNSLGVDGSWTGWAEVPGGGLTPSGPAGAMTRGADGAGTEVCLVVHAGEGRVFDVAATGTGTLTVDTRAEAAGDRWRVTGAQRNTAGAVSNVGAGSATAFTGGITIPVTSGQSYVVSVTYESPLPGTFPTSVEVRFDGPVTVSQRLPLPPSSDDTKGVESPLDAPGALSGKIGVFDPSTGM
jgi:hypothetical protein